MRRVPLVFVLAALAAAVAPSTATARIAHEAAPASGPIRIQIPLPAAGDISFAHVVITARGVPRGGRAALPRIVLPKKAALNGIPGAVAVVAGVLRDPSNRNRFQVDIAVLHARTAEGGPIERAASASGRLMVIVNAEDTNRDDTVDYSGRTAPLSLNTAARAEDGKGVIDAGPGIDTIYDGKKFVRTDEFEEQVELPLNGPGIERALDAVRQLWGGKVQSSIQWNLLGKLDHFGCDVEATTGSISTPGRQADVRVRCKGFVRQKRFAGVGLQGPFFAADVIDPGLTLRELLGQPGGGGVVFSVDKVPESQFVWALDAASGTRGNVRVEGRGGVRAVYPFVILPAPNTNLYGCKLSRDSATIPGQPHLKVDCPVPFRHVRVNIRVPAAGPVPFGVFDTAGSSRFGTCQPFGSTMLDCDGLDVTPNSYLLISIPQATGKLPVHIDAVDPKLESFRTTFLYGDPTAQVPFRILDLSHFHPAGSPTSTICGTIEGPPGEIVTVRSIYVPTGQKADGPPSLVPMNGRFGFTVTINTPGDYRIEVIRGGQVVASQPYTVPSPPAQGPRAC
jgi:hypothetical protein